MFKFLRLYSNMKNLKKIIITFILVFCIGILVAYKAMFITYNKLNKQQAVIEVNCDNFCV